VPAQVNANELEVIATFPSGPLAGDVEARIQVRVKARK
jgi:hypothetical protein